MGRESSLHRAATTNYPCCGQALGDSKGASRVALSRIVFECKVMTLYANEQGFMDKNAF